MSERRATHALRAGAAGLLLLLLPAAPGAPQEGETGEPLELDRTERVRVQLVLIDVLAVDRRGRTVAA